MAFSKAIKYGLAALSGTATGLAAGAIREDEVRLEESKSIFKAGVTKATAKQEEIADSIAEIKTENEVVEQLKGTAVDGKLLTEAQARSLHRVAKRQNKDVFEILNNYTISGEGAVTSVADKTIDIVPSGLGEIKDEGGFMQKGRNKAVADQATALLRAAGIEAKMTKPQLPKVSGVSISPIEDTDVAYSNEYVLDVNGVPVTQVMTKRVTNKKNNTTTVTYFDKVTGEQYKVKEGEKISSSADAFKQDKPFADFGPLLVFNEAGDPEFLRDNNGIVSGYLMKNGEIRLQKAGKIDTETYVPQEGQTVLVAGKDYAPSVAAGDLTAWGKMFKFPPVKDFYEALPKMRTQKQGNDLLFARSQKRLDIHAKYGNSLYGIEGGFATMVTGLTKNAKGIGNIVLGLSGLDTSGMSQEEALDAKVQYLESSGNIGLLKDFVAREEEIMSGSFIDKQAEIAMAKVMDSAIATVTAYDLAKQTGDTRISNADFDAYISTVTGNNAEQTINLIRNGLDDNLTIYKSKYENLESAKKAIPDVEALSQFKKAFDQGMDSITPYSMYKARFDTMFKPFEEKKEPKPVTIGEFKPELIDVDGAKQVKISIKGQDQPVVLKNPRYLRLFDDAVSEEEKSQITQDIQTAINRILEARAGK